MLVVALIAFGLLLAAGARGVYALTDDDVGAAVQGIWSAYAGDLITWPLVTAGLGLVRGRGFGARRASHRSRPGHAV